MMKVIGQRNRNWDIFMLPRVNVLSCLHLSTLDLASWDIYTRLTNEYERNLKSRSQSNLLIKGGYLMLAVGIDVSKSKSTAAILKSDGTILAKPFTFRHDQPEMNALVKFLKDQNEPLVILMEYTGHYHYPVLKKLEEEGLAVCMINPYLMKKYGDTQIRKAKTDKKDALRIATYALEKAYQLVPHTPLDDKFDHLKFLARQYDQRVSTLVYNKGNLTNILDETMPGLTNVLPLKTRKPDTSLSLMFIRKFGSFDRIRHMGKARFLDSYSRLADKSHNNKSKHLGLEIYELAKNSITTHSDSDYTILAQNQCLDLVTASQKAIDEINIIMQQIATTIPEYKILIDMPGVGDHLGPLLLAEMGDVRRFHSASALNAYAGNDAPVYQSGNFESHNRHISKRGNAALRKYCFEVMQALKLTHPENDPVYLYLVKKEQEGKHPKAAKMAAVNKFLRIYYARVMALDK